MASVIGNPTPETIAPHAAAPGLPPPARVTETLPGAAGMRMEEVFFLDADTFLGPVRQALRAHLSGQGEADRMLRAGAEPVFPRRRKSRRIPVAPLFP